MTNPALLQQLTRQREREIATSTKERPFPGLRIDVRERLGWSLVSLGALLARDQQVRRTAHLRSAIGRQRVGPCQQLARP